MTEKLKKRLDSFKNQVMRQASGATVDSVVSKISAVFIIAQLVESGHSQSEYQDKLDFCYEWFKQKRIEVNSFNLFFA